MTIFDTCGWLLARTQNKRFRHISYHFYRRFLERKRRMEIIRDPSEAREYSRRMKRNGKTVALVPTMGFLHDGHLSLVRIARAHADIVVASIYVNPLQFSANEDFGEYPRDVDGDRKKLLENGCVMVYEPKTMYSGQSDEAHVIGAEQASHQTYVQVESLEKPLCGQTRPHFFRGVATVVAKLFNIIEPDVAVFGAKDHQQGRVITRMTRELNFPIKIILGPTRREEDGLAMSSRNARLDPSIRPNAVALYESLKWAKGVLQDGTPTDPVAIRDEVCKRISHAGGEVDYVEVVDSETLQQVQDASAQPCVIAIAAFLPAKNNGRVRLIDNMVIEP